MPHLDFICQHCGQSFSRNIKPSDPKQHRDFCSPACRNKARQLTPVPCPICHNPFKPYKWNAEKAGYKTYCSRQCADKALIGRPPTNPDTFPQSVRDTVFALYPTTPAQALANQLGLTPGQIQSMAGRLGIKHTSDTYYNLVHQAAREYMLVHNPSRKHPYRIKHKNDRGPNWSSQRQKALLRDGKRCQICGKKVNRTQYDYGVHHIRPFRGFGGDYVSANQLANLITLCRSCHMRVERGSLACPMPLPI